MVENTVFDWVMLDQQHIKFRARCWVFSTFLSLALLQDQLVCCYFSASEEIKFQILSTNWLTFALSEYAEAASSNIKVDECKYL